uniref:Uncharacterized protein n=1 Tax=Cacopsylla melanoneura TaxID=428564 RepID=A0A8D8QFU4_9HEMI
MTLDVVLTILFRLNSSCLKQTLHCFRCHADVCFRMSLILVLSLSLRQSFLSVIEISNGEKMSSNSSTNVNYNRPHVFNNLLDTFFTSFLQIIRVLNTQVRMSQITYLLKKKKLE